MALSGIWCGMLLFPARAASAYLNLRRFAYSSNFYLKIFLDTDSTDEHGLETKNPL